MILQKKTFRELLLRTHREQLWQSCRIVSSKNSHNFSAQNPKSVKNRWIFHINQFSSKWCSGHVKPNIVKSARNFPLECRKAFLKRRKRAKTISSSFSKLLYSTCSSGHMGGSFANLSKILPQITESEVHFFQKNIFFSKCSPGHNQGRYDKTVENYLPKFEKIFIERPEIHMEPWNFFRKKNSPIFYLGEAEGSFDKLAIKSIARVHFLFTSNPNLIWNRNSKQKKKNCTGQTLRHVECSFDKPTENVHHEVRN